MFCEFKPFSRFKDVDGLRASLRIPPQSLENWCKECHMTISSCGTTAVCARGRCMAILTSQWETSSECSTFAETWSGDLPSAVTALLTVQVTSEEARESSADWTCIVIGFESGDVAFYTEQGRPLFVDRFDASPVISLKSDIGRYGSDADELHVLYGESICCLTLSVLIQTLRRCRLQLLKGSKDFHNDGQNPLTRKLAFSCQDINDASVIGLELSNTFDHLLTASVHGGFYTSYRSVAPHNTVVVGVGARPYVAFHQALEGGNTQPLLNDMARAVASKIKSALPGWLVGGKSRTEEPAVTIPTPTDKMLCRYSLCDLHRKGLTVTVSPDRRLLAVSDSLGRVILIDVRRGIAFRIFKGYRNSQCAFLQVTEDSKRSRGAKRKVLFIVFYIGKHGLLEIWPLRGPRVAAFSVSRNARLFYNPPNTRQQNKKRSGTVADSQLLLLDSDGTVKSISVPFHFALSNEDSDRSKDIHLVKKIRQLVKEKDCSNEKILNEVLNATKEIKTPEIKMHCLEMMISNKNVSPVLLLKCNDILCFNSDEEKINNPDIKKLSITHENLHALLVFFMHSNSIDFESENAEQDSEDSEVESPSEENVNDSVSITDTDLFNLNRLLSFTLSVEQKRNHNAKVTFVDVKKSVCADFISCFDLQRESEFLVLKDNLSEESSLFLSKQIFDVYIVSDLKWDDVQRKVPKTVASDSLCKLLLIYWMNLAVRDVNKERMEKFGKIMYDLCHSAGIANVYLGYGETSPWWQNVRDFLVESSCPFRSMVCAQLCRNVAQKIEREENKSDLDDTAWETVSRDNAQWGLLIGKLDDIALLSIILSQKLESHNKLPMLPIDLPEINLKYVFHKGRGSISELVGIWLCTAGISLDVLAEIDREPDDTPIEQRDEKKLLSVQFEDDDGSNPTMTLPDKLYFLRKQFPFSLSNDNLISNMAWEYVKFWSTNIENMSYLEASLKCLKAISNMPLRCGICSMMWSTYLLYPFESASKLIGKVGKLPREKLSRQNVGLSDGQLLKFLEILSDFLDLFLCGTLLSQEEESKVLRFEDIWEDSKPALTELAMMKSEVQVDVLQVHYQLSAALYYQCFLGSNYWKHCSNLFDIESQKCMFGPLNNASAFHHQLTDSRVMIQRALFLSRLVNKCVELAKDREIWIERIQDLARMWRVNDDHVRREHVTSLYALGLDAEAEEALGSVTDTKSLLEHLVPIAGRRLKHFIDFTDNRSEVIAILNPHVTTYLQSLDEVPNELVHVKSLVGTRRLIELVLAQENQKKDNSLHKTASMLLQACTSIQEDLHLGL